ncbi:MAG: hypothetical protein V1905_01070, partial [bacterium]
SISFVWKIAGVYLMKDTNEEHYLPSSTGVLGNDFNDRATRIRFRSSPLPNPIHFGAVLHENENWSGRCKVYVTQGSINGDVNWTTMIPNITPTAHNAPFGVSSVTTFNPTTSGGAGDGVTFCVDDNFGGTCYGPFRTDKKNVPAVGIQHDTITSIKIQGNYIAVLFSESDARANSGDICEVFTKSDANLRDNPIGRCFCRLFGWGCKDCLSSFIIIPTGSSGGSAVVPPLPPPPPPGTCPTGTTSCVSGICASGCARAGFVCQIGSFECHDPLPIAGCGCAPTATGAVCTSSCPLPALGGTALMPGCLSNNVCSCTCTGTPARCGGANCPRTGTGCGSARDCW